jgi:hypothetical protein
MEKVWFVEIQFFSFNYYSYYLQWYFIGILPVLYLLLQDILIPFVIQLLPFRPMIYVRNGKANFIDLKRVHWQLLNIHYHYLHYILNPMIHPLWHWKFFIVCSLIYLILISKSFFWSEMLMFSKLKIWVSWSARPLINSFTFILSFRSF